MLGGSYKHSIDSASRFVMPFEIRADLGREFFIGKGVGCLCVFRTEYVESLQKQIAEVSGPIAAILDPNVARINRHLFSEMVATRSDAQNRTPLTPEQKRYAGITTEVMIVGCGTYLELWSPERWIGYQANNEYDSGVIASGAALLAQLAAKAREQADGRVSPAGTA